MHSFILGLPIHIPISSDMHVGRQSNMLSGVPSTFSYTLHIHACTWYYILRSYWHFNALDDIEKQKLMKVAQNDNNDKKP